MPQWTFAKLDPAAVRRDPNETQLFKAEQAGEGEYAGTDALVREILQNSMDAGTDEGTVRVRIALHSKTDLPDDKVLAEYFCRLEAPLKHLDIAFSKTGIPVLPKTKAAGSWPQIQEKQAKPYRQCTYTKSSGWMTPGFHHGSLRCMAPGGPF